MISAYSKLRNIILICFLFASIESSRIGKRNEIPKFYNSNELELLRRSKAAAIKSWIDTTKDPCNDFYSYACGNWPRIYADKGEHAKWTSKSTDLRRAMDRKIMKAINSLRTHNMIESKIRNFYLSCVNVASDGCDYIETLKTAQEEFGNFSIVKTKGVGKPRDGFNWWRTAAEIHQLYGYDFMIGLEVDYVEDETLQIYLDEPTIQENDNGLAQMKDYFRKYVGASEEDSTYVASDVIRFEKSIMEAKTVPDDSNETQYVLRNLTDVHRQYRDLFDVESYLRIALNLDATPPQIYVRDSQYFDNLMNVLDNTKSDTVEDYILWRLTHKYFIDLDAVNMQSLCSSITSLYFSQYLQNKIYHEYRSNEFEHQIDQMWQNLKAAFLQSLQTEKYERLPLAIRDRDIHTLSSLNLNIDSYDDENFEEFFKDLSIDPLNYINNIKAITSRTQAMKGQPLEGMHDLPEHIPALNEIRVPVAYLLPFHLWHPSYPKAILYATIGTLVAHEMTHIFSNLWNDKTQQSSGERDHCILAQYHNITKGDKRQMTASEQLQNIADIAALELAYSAYRLWTNTTSQTVENKQHEVEALPGTPYNSHELFFISYGQRWCEGSTDEDVGQFRVLTALTNFQKFADVFKCGPSAAMNPERKCEIL